MPATIVYNVRQEQWQLYNCIFTCGCTRGNSITFLGVFILRPPLEPDWLF